MPNENSVTLKASRNPKDSSCVKQREKVRVWAYGDDGGVVEGLRGRGEQGRRE
jgi:hypothetical protein